ncbi:MAG: MBL fold metallo-hydrolase [Clostridia bacterium]|nr:MBL fold metallo-hydrolase [Clostridia bacterium]
MKQNKVALCFLLSLLMLLLALPLQGLAEGPIYRPGETDPFPEDAKLLTVRVAGMKTGDAMLITFGEESMLVDLGTGSGMEDILKMLDIAGVTAADYYCNTHPHSDHLGGFVPLVQSGFPIGAMITFFPHDYVAPSAVQKLGIRTAEEYNIPVIDKKTEDQMSLGDAGITFYRLPDRKYTWPLTCNDLSAMLKVEYGDCSILLTGDVEIRSQAVLAKLYDLKADILKVPHHGASKIEQNFLENVDPKYAFVTGGSGDSQAAQKQLRKRGVNYISFTPWGMITMQTDGTKWIVWQDLKPEMETYIQRFREQNPWLIV